MNAILQYATTNRSWARCLVISRGIPADDADDVVQNAMLKVLLADPDAINPQAYWMMALRCATLDYWKRCKRRPTQPFIYNEDGVLLTDMEDHRQDCPRQAEASEAMREACEVATSRERDAIAVALTTREHGLPNWTKQRLHHLRKRLRAAAVA